MDVKGQSAIVTGAGSGIGADVARHLAKAGARVAVLDVNKAGAEAMAREIGGVAIECDVSKAASAEAAVAAATKAIGPARILINVAASSFPAASSARMDPCHWRNSPR